MLVATLVFAAHARPPVPDLVPSASQHAARMYEMCFASGLHVVVQESRGRPLVSIRTVYAAGWADDPPGQEGTAHLAEHLWFRGDIDGVPIGRVLEAEGATFNAFTDAETVSFQTTAPIDALPTLLALEGRRLLTPLDGVTDDDLDVEREVLQAELLTTGELLSGLVRRPLYAALLPTGHRLARPTATDASLGRVDRAAIDAFVDSRWRPARATLVVIGDGGAEELGGMVLDALPRSVLTTGTSDRLEGVCRGGPAPGQPPPPIRVAEPVHVEAPVDAPEIAVGWTLPAGWRPESLANEIVAPLAQAVLRVVLRGWLGPDPAVTCSLDAEPDVSVLACGVPTGGQPADAVVERITAGVSLLDRIDWGGADLSWAGANYAAIRRTMRDSIDGLPLDARAAALAAHVHFTGSARYTGDRLAWLDGTEREDVVNVLKLITADRMAVVVVDPAGERAFGAGGVTQWFDTAPAGAYAPPAADEARLASWLAAGDLADITARTLANGLRLVVVPLDVATTRAGFVTWGGYLSTQAPGVSWVGWPVTALRTATPVGEWTLGADGYGEVVSAAADPEDLDDLLYLLRQVPRRATVHAGAGARLERLAQRAPAEKSPLTLLTEEVVHRLLPELPAVAVREPAAIRDGLREWHTRTWHPASSTLIVVGPTDPAEVARQVEARFADWKARPDVSPFGPETVRVAPVVPERAVLAVERPAPAAVVELLCVVPGRQGSPAASVLARALAAASTDRLRGQQGLAYFADAGIEQTPVGDLLTLVTSTAPDAAGEVVSTWFDLIASPRTEDEIGWAKLRLAADLQPALGARDPVFATVAETVLRGADPTALANLPSSLAAMDGDAVRAVAEGCSGHEIVGVVGPEAALAAIEARGFAVERLSQPVAPSARK